MSPIPFWLALIAPTACAVPAVPVTVPAPTALEKVRPGTRQLVATLPSGEDLRYALSIPAGYDGSVPVPLALVLHYGYSGSRPPPYTGGETLEILRPGLAELGAILVAPDALGGDWTSPQNERAAIWLVRSLQLTYNIDPQRILVTGYSLGGEGVWFLGGRHQDLFTGAIAISAPVADTGPWRIPVSVLHSDTDAVVSFDAAERRVRALRGAGVPVQWLHASNFDHYDVAAFAPLVGAAAEWMRARWAGEPLPPVPGER